MSTQGASKGPGDAKAPGGGGGGDGRPARTGGGRLVAHEGVSTQATPGAEGVSGEILARRGLFWENVVRDMLTTLSMMTQSRPEMFDGRMAVLTHAGERIPIAHVFPMFACSIVGTAWERAASGEVASTVFRITTPNGEVFTLPVSQVRSLHALSPELVAALEQAARQQEGEEDEEVQPFGFAAFRSIAGPQTPTLFDGLGADSGHGPGAGDTGSGGAGSDTEPSPGSGAE